MAVILSLKRFDQQPPVNRQGNMVTANEVWCMTLSSRVSPIEADSMLYALGPSNVYGFPAVPGLRHPDNDSILSTGFNTDRNSDRNNVGYVFHTTVNYSNSAVVTTASADPTDADPLYRSENVLVEYETEVDPIEKILITNSLGNLFLPKQRRTRTLKRWIITRNERTYNDIRSEETVEKLNKDFLNINGRSYPPRSCLLESWEGTPQFDANGREYWVNTYKILVDVKGLHLVELVDVGVQPDLAGNEPPTKVPGRPTTQPAFLSFGFYLPKEKQLNPKLTDISILKYWVNEETNMSFLGFGKTNFIGTNLGRIPRKLGEKTPPPNLNAG